MVLVLIYHSKEDETRRYKKRYFIHFILISCSARITQICLIRGNQISDDSHCEKPPGLGEFLEQISPTQWSNYRNQRKQHKNNSEAKNITQIHSLFTDGNIIDIDDNCDFFQKYVLMWMFVKSKLLGLNLCDDYQLYVQIQCYQWIYLKINPSTFK